MNIEHIFFPSIGTANAAKVQSLTHDIEENSRPFNIRFFDNEKELLNIPVTASAEQVQNLKPIELLEFLLSLLPKS